MGHHTGQHTVQEAMTANPTTVTPDTPATEAARIMRSEDTGIVPIVEGDRLAAVITDRDLTLRILAEEKSPDTPVGQLASKDVVTIDPQQGLEEAARLMAEHQVRRLPVVEEDGRLAGILSQKDLADAGYDTLTGEVVERISQ
jgi:CBS domain-containing protein